MLMACARAAIIQAASKLGPCLQLEAWRASHRDRFQLFDSRSFAGEEELSTQMGSMRARTDASKSAYPPRNWLKV